MSHSAHLYNHTPNSESGISPIEMFSRTTSDGAVIRNAHVWGAPSYVLESRLNSAGGKIPKWKPRSRRGQFVGHSPVHAKNTCLVQNLNTGYISPQHHIIMDDWFETVFYDEDTTLPSWDHLSIFNRYEVQFDNANAVPDLQDEWLSPEELARNKATRSRQRLRQGRLTVQDMRTREARDDLQHEAPPSQADPIVRDPPDTIAQTREQTSLPEIGWQREIPSSPTGPPPNTSNKGADDSNDAGPRRSSRIPKPDVKFTPTLDSNKKSYVQPKASLLTPTLICYALATIGGLSSPTNALLSYHAQSYDQSTRIQDDFHPGMLQSPTSYKAKANKDPDVPSLKESLTGPHAEEFWCSMDDEVASLESKETWTVIPRSSLPPGTKVVPGTWVQRIKRLPDGQLSKFKSRFCCRGDLQEYDGIAYSPLVGWPTVRAAMLLVAANGWKSRQVDFTLAFCQSPQPDDNPLYMELPQYYRPAGFDSQDVVLKLNKSIYGQVDSPKLFYEHLCKGMDALGFEPSEADPCLFIHREHKIMVLNYCDDQIWLSPDDNLIEEYVGKLKDLGYDLTLEPDGDIFAFLGINFKRIGKEIVLTQTGLINKVINYTGMDQASTKPIPAACEPLGTDANGEPFDEEWSYPAAVGMLLYISSNSRPDIQFAVHQVARFSHCPKKSHAQAIKRIIRYLIGTREHGIKLEPDLTKGLDCWCDADFAGLWGYEDDQDPVSVKSRTGFSLTLFNCPIIWSSKLQTDITLSSTAAEYVAFSMAMRELIPMRTLLLEISERMELTVIKESLVLSTVFEDNQSCLSCVNVPKMSTRNKYLALKYHFFRSFIGRDKGIIATYIPATLQRADILTKGLPENQFVVIQKLLMGW